MDISIFFAQVLGIVLLVSGISLVANKKMSAEAIEEMLRNKGILWMAGFTGVVIGSVFVVLNNIWSSSLPLLITIIGWLILLKGTFILVFPNAAVALYRKCNKGNMLLWGGLIAIIIGLILLDLGFMYL